MKPKPIELPRWPTSPKSLLGLGASRLLRFCVVNDIPMPGIHIVSKDDWCFDACAYYRPETGRPLSEGMLKLKEKGYGPDGINICLEHCGTPCGESGRNWSWPGTLTDRTVYGVLAHELGHHCDWWASERKGKYGGDYSGFVRKESKEPAVSSYCPNDMEWFAEVFRVYVTNPALLAVLRPKAHGILSERFEPADDHGWRFILGSNVPARVVSNLVKKGAR